MEESLQMCEVAEVLSTVLRPLQTKRELRFKSKQGSNGECP